MTARITEPDQRIGSGDRYSWIAPTLIVSCVVVLAALWLNAQPLGQRLDSGASILGSAASFAGLAGTVLLSAAVVLSARLPFMETVTGGLDHEYTLHHRVGSAALVLIALHPALLAWRYAQFSWSSAAGLWDPRNADLPVRAGQLALYAMAACLAVTIYVRISHRLLIWLQRVLGLLFPIAAYHALNAGGDIAAYRPLRVYVLIVLIAGLMALAYHAVVGRVLSRRARFVVTSITQRPGRIADVRLRPLGRPLRFVPGQFAYLRFIDQSIGGEAHPFTIASSPSVPELRFVIKDLGDYTHRIGTVTTGAQAFVEGPFGRFSHRFVRRTQQVWIAGGIGIAPFLAMAESMRQSDYDIDLYYGFSDDESAAFLEELQNRATTTPRLRVHAVCEARDGYISADRVASETGPLQEREFLICGPPPMMHAVRDQLRAMHVPRRQIHLEELAFR